MRERVAIIFMTLSIVATLALGGAISYQFAHAGGQTVPLAQGSPGAALGGTSGTSGPSGPSGTQGTKGRYVGGTAGSGGKTAGQLGGTQSAAQGVGNGVITVGGIFDETGPVDSTVERDTVRSYFDLVNAQGGVGGYKLRLLDCDSQYNPSQAHVCAQKLLSEGVLAIVGWLSVSGEQNEASYFSQQGVPMIGGLGVPAEYSSSISYPTAPSLVTGGVGLGDRAAQLHLTKPGIVILNANFAQPILNALLKTLHQHGIHEADIENVDATKADYTDVVLKMRQDGAQSIIAGLDPFSYARLYQAMQRQNWRPPFLGAGLDKTSANSAYGSAVYGADSITPVLEPADHHSTPAIQQYLGAVQQYFPYQEKALDVYSEYQWLAAEVFAQAIRNIGGKPVTRASLAGALNKMSNFSTGGITNPISYSPGSSHDPLHCFQWLHNNNGQWTTVSGWNCV